MGANPKLDHRLDKCLRLDGLDSNWRSSWLPADHWTHPALYPRLRRAKMAPVRHLHWLQHNRLYNQRFRQLDNTTHQQDRHHLVH